MKATEIVCAPHNGGFRAAFGFALQSIKHSSMLCPPHLENSPEQSWRTSHKCNVQFLQVLSRWTHPCSFELHILSRPSLYGQVPGQIDISLRFFVEAGSRQEALELALADSFRLNMLLETLWPAARFQAMDLRRLAAGYEPFTPQGCLVVGRQSQIICPANPLNLRRPSIGFIPGEPRTADFGSTVPCLELLHVYPWVPSVGEDLSNVLEALLHLPTPRWIIIRIASEAKKQRDQALLRLNSTIEACEKFLSGTESEQVTLTGQTQALRNASLDRFAQLSDTALRGSVLVLSPGPADFVMASLLGQAISGDHGRRQTESLLEGGFAISDVPPTSALLNSECIEEEPWTAEEGACAFRLPLITDRHSHGLTVQRHRTAEYQVFRNDGSILDQIQLGVNLHNGQSRPVLLNTRDRLHHTLLIGATGSGKSTTLLSMALQDARAGRGFALIDPAGDLADQFLERFPRERKEDLTIVDLDDRESLVPLNLLTWKTPQERDLLIDTFYSTLLSTYGNPEYFGPVFESHFRSTLRLLLGDQPRSDFIPTLLEFPRVFRSPSFRKYLLDQSTDADVRAAILEANRVTSGDHRLENIAPYITSKLTRFLQDTQVRRIVGHGRMALDFREIMDRGRIVVFKLAQGRLGRHVSDMLLAQLVAMFRWAAMSRADIPESARKPFFLYCDEFQVIADETFADMLSTSRKWGLGLILANQFATQLQERRVLESVLANVGTIISFRVGVRDAQLLAPVFEPSIGARDLVESPHFQGYVRFHSQRVPVRPFSFHNLQDSTPAGGEWAQQLREVSRSRWSVSTEEAELAITQRNLRIECLLDSSVT
jgi:hypothetical protein